MRTTLTVRLQDGEILTPGPGHVDVEDPDGTHGLTISGRPDELETLAAHLKAAAALERTRVRQAQGAVQQIERELRQPGMVGR